MICVCDYPHKDSNWNCKSCKHATPHRHVDLRPAAWMTITCAKATRICAFTKVTVKCLPDLSDLRTAAMMAQNG